MKNLKTTLSFYSLALLIASGTVFQACKIQQVDTTQMIAQNPKFTKPQGGARELWQKQSDDDEIDEIIRYNDDYLLVSSIKYIHL